MKYQESTALISDCKKYRYLLRRAWDLVKPRYLFVMLNPSTADAEKDDATIRSLYRLSSALGAGSFEVVNLFAYRATDPDELHEADNPIGPQNDFIIGAAASRCDMLICAWGAHAMAEARGRVVRQELRYHRPAVFCLGTTKSGAPKHPLYIKTGTELAVYGF